MAAKKLAVQVDMLCVVCPGRTATKVCFHCEEKYCETCSDAHKKMKATKDHLQKDLPKMASNTAGTASQESFSGTDHSASFLPSIDGTQYSRDARSRQSLDKERVKMEARLCEEGVSRLKNAVTIVDKNIRQLQLVKKRLEDQQQLLTRYTDLLASPDDVTVTEARAVMPHLHRAGQTCRQPTLAAFTALTDSVEGLMSLTASSGSNRPTARSDPMTSLPRRVCLTKPTASGDQQGPFIAAIVSAGNGLFLMIDQYNNQVKAATLGGPSKNVEGVNLGSTPQDLTLVEENPSCVAVTADDKRIYYVTASCTPTITTHVPTARNYMGVASEQEDDTLVVGCEEDEDGPASVDVITRTGVTLRTVVDSYGLPELNCPRKLCVYDGEVLVSDRRYTTKTVFRVKLFSDLVVDKLTHPDMKFPSQVAVDADGNCYIASANGNCVLVVTPSGQWRKLLEGCKDGDGPRIQPYGVCVTDSGLVVAWHDSDSYTVLANYII